MVKMSVLAQASHIRRELTGPVPNARTQPGGMYKNFQTGRDDKQNKRDEKKMERAICAGLVKKFYRACQ